MAEWEFVIVSELRELSDGITALTLVRFVNLILWTNLAFGVTGYAISNPRYGSTLLAGVILFTLGLLSRIINDVVYSYTWVASAYLFNFGAMAIALSGRYILRDHRNRKGKNETHEH